ncbi:hypothetical protein X801_06610 [Opisthorchis viverrini]|uniref:Metallothionein n=1 Tax=Opisthorchis viverrini TaxID=6198 RepID=A0A1S8WST8_OPIVI|nr:hypothetical protein X801_06610 [Opisthorchis viverrini]
MPECTCCSGCKAGKCDCPTGQCNCGRCQCSGSCSNNCCGKNRRH